MNTYEQKQAAKQERYLELSEKAKDDSNATYKKAKDMASCIPLGQPILVGHHSENRDRNYRDKIHNTYGKAFELDDKANYYKDKAESIGTGGVSSDDPEAIQKITKKINAIKANNEHMKEINKLWRKTYSKVAKIRGLKNRTGKEAFYANDDEIKAFKIAIEEFKKLDKTASECILEQVSQYSYNCTKLKPYWTDTAEIRRLEKRVKDLRAVANFDHKEIVKDSYRLVQDPEENRLMFFFDGKPVDEIRKILKQHSFKWSPSSQAWVRMITGNAMYSVKRAMMQLDTLESEKGCAL